MDLVSYWCWELEYGKRYKDGCVTEKDGTIIDISTPEKLWKYLEEEVKRNERDSEKTNR